MENPTSPSRTAERISQVVFTYAARIGREHDPDRLLLVISEMARDLVGADRCSIWIQEQESGELWTKVAHGEGVIRVPRGAGLVGACVAQGESVLVNNTAEDPRFSGQVDRKTGYETRSVLAVPLFASDGHVIGAFQALNKPGGFDASDVDLLQLAAAYSASAIEEQRLRQQAERAKLVLQELQIAREVQQQLFPVDLPKAPGFDYAAVCRPAKGVGGDYYDFFWLPDGNLGLTEGDVSGKGIAAAIMMASIQSSLRGLWLRGAPSLTRLMDEFSKTVWATSTPDRYSTLFCAQIEVDARRLTYVSAGHQSPLLVRANHGSPRLERLDVGGIPIGLLPIARYEQESVVLERGDTLVCYSDGISETMNAAGEIWREAVLEELILRHLARPANELIEAIIRAADEYAAGAEQHDDMTIVVLKVL